MTVRKRIAIIIEVGKQILLYPKRFFKNFKAFYDYNNILASFKLAIRITNIELKGKYLLWKLTNT